jgi:hypothetical protein
LRLVGRRRECDALDSLIADVLGGASRVTVLRGEAGVGKSALLGYLSDRVAGWRIATTAGFESEMELAYSGLHQLCAPMLDHLVRLPAPQRDALATVLGMSTGPAPDRFLVGVATLTLVAEVAEQQPLICVIEDAQWLDQASAQVIGFVARRLLAERIALVGAARRSLGDHVLAGLPELAVEGLGDGDARALLLENVHGPLDAAVRDQIIAESHGNPLALLELPRAWNATALAGGFGLPEHHQLVGKIEQSFVQRLHQLPSETQLLVLVAAAEPLGDRVLLHRAAELLGVDIAAADSAVEAGLLKVGARVEFIHPLARSAAYRSADTDDRHRVHGALAEATHPETDPDRRAWHRARATSGTDEDVAAELERSADRAQSRGGLAATASFLGRATALTAEPSRRAQRALAAAEASLHAGAFDAALEQLATAETGPLDEFEHSRVDLVRAHVAFASGFGNDAPPLLLKAARRLEALDLELARETYLNAWVAATFAGDPGLLEICRAIRALPSPPAAPRALDLLLDGLALLITDGHAAAASTLRQAKKALANISLEEVLRWGWAAVAASDTTWDYEVTRAISQRNVQLVRSVGALAQLPNHLAALANVAILGGDFAGAAVLATEAESVASATGSRFGPYIALRLKALEGKATEAEPLIASAIEQAGADGQQLAATVAHWAAAILYNGLGRYADAAAAAGRATSDTFEPFVSTWALPELIEAAARSGDADLARDALERLETTTQPCDTDFAFGMEVRARALLSDGASAEHLYRKAIERLGAGQLRPELARAHLLYGEWLRRNGRRSDARQQLRAAHEMLGAIGMAAFAERARRELIATGEKAPQRSPEKRDQLTPQEEQIARLARDGLSNPEIGAQLYISSRRQLRAALPAQGHGLVGV